MDGRTPKNKQHTAEQKPGEIYHVQNQNKKNIWPV